MSQIEQFAVMRIQHADNTPHYGFFCEPIDCKGPKKGLLIIEEKTCNGVTLVTFTSPFPVPKRKTRTPKTKKTKQPKVWEFSLIQMIANGKTQAFKKVIFVIYRSWRCSCRVWYPLRKGRNGKLDFVSFLK
jgi:hypothetical protein